MAELPKDPIPPLTAARIYMACKREVSFATLAKSSTSRCAIAAASGISSADRVGVLLNGAEVLGFKGILNLQHGS
jgi:hypothetical protein